MTGRPDSVPRAPSSENDRSGETTSVCFPFADFTSRRWNRRQRSPAASAVITHRHRIDRIA